MIPLFVATLLFGCCESNDDCRTGKECRPSGVCANCEPLTLCLPDYNWSGTTCIPYENGTALLFGDLQYQGKNDLAIVESMADDIRSIRGGTPFYAFVQVSSIPLGHLGFDSIMETGYSTKAHILEDERIADFYQADEHDFVLIGPEGCEHGRYTISEYMSNQDIEDVLAAWLESLAHSR